MTNEPNVLARATLKRMMPVKSGSPEVWTVEVVLSDACGHEELTALRQGVVLGTCELSLAGRAMRAVVVPVERR